MFLECFKTWEVDFVKPAIEKTGEIIIWEGCTAIQSTSLLWREFRLLRLRLGLQPGQFLFSSLQCSLFESVNLFLQGVNFQVGFFGFLNLQTEPTAPFIFARTEPNFVMRSGIARAGTQFRFGAHFLETTWSFIDQS